MSLEEGGTLESCPTRSELEHDALQGQVVAEPLQPLTVDPGLIAPEPARDGHVLTAGQFLKLDALGLLLPRGHVDALEDDLYLVTHERALGVGDVEAEVLLRRDDHLLAVLVGLVLLRRHALLDVEGTTLDGSDLPVDANFLRTSRNEILCVHVRLQSKVDEESL